MRVQSMLWNSERRIRRHDICVKESEIRTMDAMVIGAALVGSIATAFVVERAVLGAMFRAFGRDKAARR